MKIRVSLPRHIFNSFNVIILTIVALSCTLPIIHVLAISLSSNNAASAGHVGLIPVDFTLASYEYLTRKLDFFRSVGISVMRVLVGTTVNMILLIITAYPLSKSNKVFRGRNIYMIFFVITMFLSAGLIPTYMIIRNLGLLNNYAVLILPGALNVWLMIILMNFMRGIPKSLEEAAAIDGASYWKILFLVVVPVSLPSLASLLLFSMINHWNAWFDGMFYMNNVNKYPMATYLATQIMSSNRNMTNMTPEQLEILAALSEKTVRSAQLFISIVPILIVYPFLQRFFIKGIVVGAVKE